MMMAKSQLLKLGNIFLIQVGEKPVTAFKQEGVQVLLMEEDDNDLYDDDPGE